MKKALILCSLLYLTGSAQAQVKIGNNATTIDFASILELEHPNKALYITRVSLTSTSDNATVPNPKAGMVVYNTNASLTGTGATGAGMYYWNGAIWVSTNAAATTTGLAWLLLGNAGTLDGVNFLGTTDNAPLNFRVGGAKAGRIELGGVYNTSNGVPSYGNVALGFGSQNLNAPTPAGAGSFNTSVGNYTLNNNTTGRRNSAFGYDALGQNSTGDSNAAFGFGALQVNTTGNNNTATGAYSLNHNTIGAHNTAVGYEALLSNISDSGNTAIGAYSLYNNNGGKGNVAMGLGAGFPLTTGDSNTFIGTAAGAFFATTTSSNNTYLGFGANGIGINLRWTGAVGSNSIVTVANGLVLGATDAGAGAKNSLTYPGGTLTPQPMTSSLVGINVTDPTQRIDFRNGHIRNRQDVLPTTSIPTSAGNGVTGAAIASGGSDVRGMITTTGYNNANALTQIRVNFQYQATNPPIVTVTPANESASTTSYYVESDTNGFTLYFRNVYSGSNATGPAALFNYHVIE
jgi:hypothetical protein